MLTCDAIYVPAAGICIIITLPCGNACLIAHSSADVSRRQQTSADVIIRACLIARSCSLPRRHADACRRSSARSCCRRCPLLPPPPLLVLVLSLLVLVLQEVAEVSWRKMTAVSAYLRTYETHALRKAGHRQPGGAHHEG